MKMYDKLVLLILFCFMQSSFANDATLLEKGVSFYNEHNYVKAWDIFYNLTKKSNANAMYWIGYMYETGHGRDSAGNMSSHNIEKAKEWYELSAKHGLQQAKERIETINTNMLSKLKFSLGEIIGVTTGLSATLKACSKKYSKLKSSIDETLNLYLSANKEGKICEALVFEFIFKNYSKEEATSFAEQSFAEINDSFIAEYKNALKLMTEKDCNRWIQLARNGELDVAKLARKSVLSCK